MEAALKHFFSAAKFGVVGASSDTSKYGHKIFAWYLGHSLPATPINSRSSEVTVKSKSYPTVSSPKDLEDASSTSLSIITPPKITLDVLKEAKDAGITAVWLQPGTYNDEVLSFAKKEFQAAIAGFESDSISTNGGEGWCVLVDGEDGLDLASRKWKAQKL